MPEKPTGKAKVIHKDTGECYEIDADDVDWSTEWDREGDPGSSKTVTGTIDHDDLGDLEWSYDVTGGIFTPLDHDLGGHSEKEDFDL